MRTKCTAHQPPRCNLLLAGLDTGLLLRQATMGRGWRSPATNAAGSHRRLVWFDRAGQDRPLCSANSGGGCYRAGGNACSDAHARKLANPAVRRRIVPLIHLAREKDEQAAGLVEQVLTRL
jgi:hypothetical protein